MSLISRFRSGLKEEIGMFFPMLILRVLENVLQPSFLQKMTVLSFLEKISEEPQVIIDIFVNFDCDVDAPNIFERYAIIIFGWAFSFSFIFLLEHNYSLLVLLYQRYASLFISLQ